MPSAHRGANGTLVGMSRGIDGKQRGPRCPVPMVAILSRVLGEEVLAVQQTISVKSGGCCLFKLCPDVGDGYDLCGNLPEFYQISPNFYGKKESNDGAKPSAQLS